MQFWVWRTPIIPLPLGRALACVGAKLSAQHDVAADFVGIVDGLNALPPEMLGAAERDIYEAADLFPDRCDAHSFLARMLHARLAAQTQLERVPGLEYLFVFHRDGHLREAALRKISGGLPSAFLFAAVAWRLNDWAPPVRAAAAECAARTFPLTRPEVVAEAAQALVTREASWRRWGDERAVLIGTFDRPDVAACLAEAIIARQTGPTARILQFALRGAGLDPHLERIAREAVQPAVRALAFRTLVDGYARWPEGWEFRWIDKSMGLRRQQTAFRQRPLGSPPARDLIIEAAAVDRSASVRKVALDGLIRHDLEGPQTRRIAARLLSDPARSVRERAEFVMKQDKKSPG
jgi:hypothetical protein